MLDPESGTIRRYGLGGSVMQGMSFGTLFPAAWKPVLVPFPYRARWRALNINSTMYD